jgi:FixJ family two-component response regulator
MQENIHEKILLMLNEEEQEVSSLIIQAIINAQTKKHLSAETQANELYRNFDSIIRGGTK